MLSDFWVGDCLIDEMQGESDVQLLGRYAHQGCEAAFGEIVARHADLVYCTALRLLDRPELAEEIAQSVFIDLARKARSLSNQLRPDASVVGWLYRSARFAALDIKRAAHRRRTRENLAMSELHLTSTAPESFLDWERLRPLLDEALSLLREDDREAVLLRFFKNQDFRAVGLAMGISDDAAQKRVARALEKLRVLLARRGLTTSAAALSLAMSAHAVAGAPSGLAALISNAALEAAGVPTAVALTKIVAMTTMQKALVGAVFVAAIGTGIHQAHRASRLNEQILGLQQQQAALGDQLEQVTRERDRALGQARLSRQEIQSLRSGLQPAKQLAGGGTDPTEIAVSSWVQRINLLKQRLEQTPEAKIPELRFLKALDWVEVAANNKLETEVDYRKALAELRRRADGYFVEQLHSALGKYLQANNGQWPDSVSQLEGDFEPPVERAVWERWEIVPTSAFPGQTFAGQRVLTEASAVDPEFDSRHTVDSPNSGGVGPFHPYGYQPAVSEEEHLKSILEPVLTAYKAANGGQEPGDPAQLQPYLTNPEQEAALQHAIALMNQPSTERYRTTIRDSTVQHRPNREEGN